MQTIKLIIIKKRQFLGNENIVKVLLQNGARVNDVDAKGKTALHFAAQYGRVEIGKILINSCASLNLKDEMGRTPLHLASEFGE